MSTQETNPISTPTLTQGDVEENKAAKTNLIVYFICMAFGSASAPVNIALGGLVGNYLLAEDKSLATVPVTSFNVGTAIGTVIANAIMRPFGRKIGFMIGCVFGVIGMICCGFSIMAGNFWAFVASTGINGIALGFTQQYRFAVADRGTPEFKPKAISIILFGGVVAAVVGPQLILYTGDWADPVPFAGAYFAAIGLFILSFGFLFFLNSSNLSSAEEEELSQTPSRSLWELFKQPTFFIAALCGASTYALMSFVMTGAPLAMTHHGHSVEDATLGIQWHVIAMFAPSLITGLIIARIGKIAVVAMGLAILIACAIVALMGVELMHFWIALILLGLGWNFGFVGATAMITETYKPHEKNKAQGLNDIIVFGLVAFSSLMAGISLNAYGWSFLNWVVFPVSIACLVSLFWLKTSKSAH